MGGCTSIRRRRSRTEWTLLRPGRRFSMSGANRRGRGQRRWAWRRSCGGWCRSSKGWRRSRREISVDTSKAAVAAAALDAGAAIVNDVTALRGDPEMAALCADRGATVVLMHMRGNPRTMQENPVYDDVVAEVKAFLAERVEAAVAAGVAEERIWLDPGIGFGKTAEHNLELLRRLASCASWAGRWSSAPRARASSAGSTAPTRASASAARSPPRCSPPPRAPRCCASTMSPRSARRWPSPPQARPLRVGSDTGQTREYA